VCPGHATAFITTFHDLTCVRMKFPGVPGPRRLRGERARCLRLRKSVKLPLLGEGRPALCRDRHGRGVYLTQHLRETLHILYCVHLGDQRDEVLSPLPPEHRIDLTREGFCYAENFGILSFSVVAQSLVNRPYGWS
jgi:hypothetical protein